MNVQYRDEYEMNVQYKDENGMNVQYKDENEMNVQYKDENGVQNEKVWTDGNCISLNDPMHDLSVRIIGFIFEP